MNVLGIESSCDETGVAIVNTKKGLLAHALHSQIEMHRDYGGVVSELATRDSIRRLLPLTRQWLGGTPLRLEGIDSIAYKAGAGAAGGALVGGSAGSACSWGM